MLLEDNLPALLPRISAEAALRCLEILTALFVIKDKDFDFSTNTVNVYLLICESLTVISD